MEEQPVETVSTEVVETTGGDDKAKRLQAVYSMLDSDEAYRPYVPPTYNEFLDKVSKDEKYARAIHKMVASDEVYSTYLPETFEETVQYFGLGKPSVKPQSASGLASQQQSGLTPQAQSVPPTPSQPSEVQQTSTSGQPDFGFGGVVEKIGVEVPLKNRLAKANAIPDIKTRKIEQAKIYNDISRKASIENQSIEANLAELDGGIKKIESEAADLSQKLSDPNIDQQTAMQLQEMLQQTQAHYSEAVNLYNEQLTKAKENAKVIKTMSLGVESAIGGRGVMGGAGIFMPKNPDEIYGAGTWNAIVPNLLKTLGATVEIVKSNPLSGLPDVSGEGDNAVSDALFNLADNSTIDVGKRNEKANVSILEDVNSANVSNLLGNLTGSIATTFAGGGAVGATGSQIAGFSQVFGDVYKEGRDAGLTENEAMIFAAPTSIMAAYLGDKGIESVTGAFTKASTKSALKEAIKEIGEKKSASALLEFGKKFALNTLEGSGKEALQEGTEAATQYGSELAAEESKLAKFDKDLSIETFKKSLAESMIAGAAGGGLLGGFFGANANSHFAEIASKAQRNPKVEKDFMDNLQAALISGDINEQQKADIEAKFEKAKQATAQIPPNVKNEKAIERSTELILRQEELNSQIEQVNPAMAKPLQDELKQVDKELADIASSETSKLPEPKSLSDEVYVGDVVDLTSQLNPNTTTNDERQSNNQQEVGGSEASTGESQVGNDKGRPSEEKQQLLDEQERIFTPNEAANKTAEGFRSETSKGKGGGFVIKKPTAESENIVAEMDAVFEKKGQNFKAQKSKFESKYGDKAKQAVDINRNFEKYKDQLMDAGIIKKIEC